MSTVSSATGSTNSLSMDDFITLFLAQIQSQDPLEPMESSDFTAQLAMYSQVSGIEQMNENLESLISMYSTSQNSTAVSYLGKEVIVAGNSFEVKEGVEEYEFDYVLGAGASDVQIYIKNAEGETVAIIDDGSRTAGRNTFTWDGKDGDGVAVEAGTYTFEVDAKDLEGEDVAVQEFTRGTVTGVGFEDGTALFEVNGEMFTLADIVKVYENEG